MGWSIFKTKTFWGAVVLAAGQLLADHSPSGIVQAIGTIVAAAGVRSAIAKNGEGK